MRPDLFLHCMRALSHAPHFVHRMRTGLKEARRRLGYGSPAKGLATLTGGVLDELLVSAVTPNRHTPRRGRPPHLNMATDPFPLAEPRKGRNALDLREACAAL